MKKKITGTHIKADNQFYARLAEIKKIGVSRHDEKKQKGRNLDTLHSYNSVGAFLENYNLFKQFCIDNENIEINKKTTLTDMRQYCEYYLEYCFVEKKDSAYTIHSKRAELNKLYGLTNKPNELKIKLPENCKLKKSQITKNRTETDYSKKFNRGKNKDIVTMARAFGFRRRELQAIKKNNFYKKNEMLIVKINNGKGGKKREVTCDPKLQKDVEKILQEKKDGKLYTNKISQHFNVHRERAKYCQSMYRQISNNKELSYKIMQNLDIKRRQEKVKSNIYRTRNQAKNKMYDRDSLYITSHLLGHERLSVIVESYFYEMKN